MCSYNQINGVYACENPILNRRSSRATSGFHGLRHVRLRRRALHRRVARDRTRPGAEPSALLHARAASTPRSPAGQITQAQIDAAAFRVISAYIRGGLFDHPLPATRRRGRLHRRAQGDRPPDRRGGHRPAEERRRAAAPGRGGHDDRPVRPDGVEHAHRTASARHPSAAWRWRFNNARHRVTLRGPRLARDGDHANVPRGRRDRDVQPRAPTPRAAPRMAAAADVAIVFGYQRMGEFNDLPDLHLQGDGDALIAAVAAANPTTIVVLHTGSAVEMPWIYECRRVFEAWYGGEQVGPALAWLLFGDVSPSGKLPMSFPTSLADMPTNTPEQYPGIFAERVDDASGRVAPRSGRSTTPRASQVGTVVRGAGHRTALRLRPRPLVHRRSSTSQVQVTPEVDRRREGDPRSASSSPTPVSACGTEIAQAYVELPESAGEPSQRLVGWEHVTLAAGRAPPTSRSRSRARTSPTCGCCSTGTPTPRRGRPRRARTPCTSAVRSTPTRRRSSASSSTTARRRRRGTGCPAPPATARRAASLLLGHPPRTSALYGPLVITLQGRLPSIADVAELAASRCTVSNVLYHPTRSSASTIRKCGRHRGARLRADA